MAKFWTDGNIRRQRPQQDRNNGRPRYARRHLREETAQQIAEALAAQEAAKRSWRPSA